MQGIAGSEVIAIGAISSYPFGTPRNMYQRVVAFLCVVPVPSCLLVFGGEQFFSLLLRACGCVGRLTVPPLYISI